MIKLEDKAPEFCLPNQDDIEICLRDLKGKWIVLYFYPRDNTPGCTTEACEFTEAAPDFSDLDAVILGVSADSTKKHRNFIEKKELGITLLMKYGIKKNPITTFTAKKTTFDLIFFETCLIVIIFNRMTL